MKKNSTTSNTREDQIIPWVNYDKRDDKEDFIVLDSSFPKYRWDNIKIKDKKEFLSGKFPTNSKTYFKTIIRLPYQETVFDI